MEGDRGWLNHREHFASEMVAMCRREMPRKVQQSGASASGSLRLIDCARQDLPLVARVDRSVHSRQAAIKGKMCVFFF